MQLNYLLIRRTLFSIIESFVGVLNYLLIQLNYLLIDVGNVRLIYFSYEGDMEPCLLAMLDNSATIPPALFPSW
jgi:hypothetical protein